MSDKYKGTILAGIVFIGVFCFMFGFQALLAIVPMIGTGLLLIIVVTFLDIAFRDRRKKAYVKSHSDRKHLL